MKTFFQLLKILIFYLFMPFEISKGSKKRVYKKIKKMKQTCFSKDCKK